MPSPFNRPGSSGPILGAASDNGRRARGVSIPVILIANFLLCTLIALIMWLMVPTMSRFGFYKLFVHSQSIGFSVCGLAILTTWFAEKFLLRKAWVQPVSIAIVSPLGVLLGMFVAQRMLGLPIEPLDFLTDPGQRDATLLATFIASIAFIWFLSSRENIARLNLVASEERRRADNAQHAMLRAQLEPHMLFNTLANLRALINTDTERALEMLDRLDSFLRESLKSSRASTGPLSAEFELLENYLALMKIRMGERMTYRLNLPAECAAIPVPSLLLQPLVENAIRHGIEPSVGGGHIEIAAAVQAKQLLLSVTDSGAGMRTQSNPEAGGIGLQNIRERLTQSFGNDASLTISAPGDSKTQAPGTHVQIRLPLASGTMAKTVDAR